MPTRKTPAKRQKSWLERLELSPSDLLTVIAAGAGVFLLMTFFFALLIVKCGG